MANRNTFNGSSADVPWPNTGMPEGFGDQYARHIKTLYDVAAFPLSAIGGTANDVTATLDPALDSGGLVDGMKFTLTWAVNNTGPMTLRLNGGAAIDVLQADGSAMISGAAKAGTRVLLEYIGGDFRLIGGGSSGGGGGGGSPAPYYQTITASATWTKPVGYDDNAIVEIEAIGGGGGGGRVSSTNSAGGGGGGGYSCRKMRYADVPASVAVVIGAGGSGLATNGNGGNGGNTTFGALLTGYGGEGGTSSAAGGGGGGELMAGGQSFGPGSPGAIGGGYSTPSVSADISNWAKTLWGGGGGGLGVSGAGTVDTQGGPAVFGGGGGGGTSTSGAAMGGGQSLFGGSGGNGSNGTTPATAGSAPGGGGGAGRSNASGAGARGEVRIRIYG